MIGGIPMGGGERPRAFHPHMQVAFNRVPDRAVDLQRFLSHESCSLACIDLGEGDINAGVTSRA